MADTPTTAEGLSISTGQGRWVVAATVLGSGIASLDATVVGIALPTIGRTFHTGVGTLQWVSTGYTLTLAALLLLGGSLGDRLGRRRTFTVGVVWFAVASAACGLAPTSTTLILARVIQGVGGALLAPASLAILQASFRPDDRARAIGAWSGLGGLASAAGPLVGGYLIAAASWRLVFFINVPLAALVVAISARHVPETRDPTTAGRLDVTGAALAVLALSGLTYGLIEGPTSGWTSPIILAALIVAAASLVGFVLVERHLTHPMLPVDIFTERQFTAANAVTFAVYAALSGTLFLVPVELQVVSGYTPIEAGLSLLPVTLIMLVFSARSGRLASKIGPRLQMTAGPLVVAAGLLLLTRAADGANYPLYVLPAVVVFGAGLAINVAPLTATALAAAPADHAGTASAINNVVARTAGLIAVAVLPVAAGITGAGALRPHHLAHGFRVAVTIAAGLCTAGGILAGLTIRNPPHPSQRRWRRIV